MAGLGWKWLINEFSIDLGFGYGKQIFLSTPDDADVVDVNTYPYNVAVDGYLLVGYRF